LSNSFSGFLSSAFIPGMLMKIDLSMRSGWSAICVMPLSMIGLVALKTSSSLLVY